MTQDYFEFGNRLSWTLGVFIYLKKERCCLVLNELASSASFRNVCLDSLGFSRYIYVPIEVYLFMIA